MVAFNSNISTITGSVNHFTPIRVTLIKKKEKKKERENVKSSKRKAASYL